MCTKVGMISRNLVFMLVCRHGIVNCRVSELWRKREGLGWQQEFFQGRDGRGFWVFFSFFFQVLEEEEDNL